MIAQNQLRLANLGTSEIVNTGIRYPVTMPPVQGPITVTAPSPPVTGTPTLPGVGSTNTTPVTGTQTGTVSDGASGGTAMSGLDDLFGSIGTMFNNLLHPGTSSATGATTAATVTDNSWMIWVVVALIVYFVFIK